MKRLGRIEITTKIGCSCNCVYCPQELLLKRYFNRSDNANPETMLSFESYKTCIDKLPKGTRIDFSGMAEPWLNPQCTDMVLYAHDRGFSIAIYTTLVGMSQKDFERIKDIPCAEFVLHIPDDKSNSHINVTSEYISLLEEVIAYKRSDGSSLVTGVSCHASIHPAILSAVPKDSHLITEIHNRAGNLNNEYVESKQNKGQIICINCDNNLHHNVLLPDGTVLLCCMDYGMKHILGNLLTQSYEEILQSQEALKVREGMNDDSKDILCRMCVNARSLTELYDDYATYKDWTNNLLCQNHQRMKELSDYRNWVKNLQKQIEEQNMTINALQKQNEEFAKYNNEYKEWVKNLENHLEEQQSVIESNEKNVDELVEDNHEYSKWVKNLQTQIEEQNVTISALQKQNEEFAKYNNDYKDWVEKLQKQLAEQQK